MNGADQVGSLLDLLDRLIDPVEPPPVSMMPQTWGWAVLAALLLIAVALALAKAHRRYRANAYRRAALHELERVGDDPRAVALLLRRTALAAYPRRKIAALSGEEWLRFLDAQVGGSGFRTGPGRLVARAPYVTVAAEPSLPALAARWIRHHRGSP